MRSTSPAPPPPSRPCTPAGTAPTARPSLTGIDDLALTHLHHLRDRGLRDVFVVGSSLGGWTATEMAVRDTAGIITGLVLIDAVGVHIEREPIADCFALDARAVAEHAWHDSDRYYLDPADLPTEEQARRQTNMATMRILAGDPAQVPRLWWDFWAVDPRPDGSRVRYGPVVNDLESLLHVVAAGEAMCFLPAAARGFFPRPGIRYLDVIDLEPSTSALVWLRERHAEPTITAIRQAAQTFTETHPPESHEGGGLHP